MVNGVATKLTGTAESVDLLSEYTADTFTVKVAGTYRVEALVQLLSNAATTGINLVNQSASVRKNSVVQASSTAFVTWPYPNSTACAIDVFPVFVGALVANDTIDISATMTFTATAPTANIVELKIERVL
jgi:hypothetical protein